MTMQLNREASADQELVLNYRNLDGLFGCIVITALFGSLSVPGLLVQFFCLHELLIFAGWMDASGRVIAEDAAAQWPIGVWFVVLFALFVVGTLVTLWFGRLTVRIAVMCWRSLRRCWWLRLSSWGFEVNDVAGKPRRYEWHEIDKFMLVGSRDTEGDSFVGQVGFRYSPERRRTLVNKLWLMMGPPCDRGGTKADGLVMGYWDRPFDEAVDLMNEWLTRYKAA